MKDFVSRLTFGFLMAQLFPGAVTVFAITFAYMSFEGRLPNAVVASVDLILNTWAAGTTGHKLFLAGLFIAFGMLIHGIHCMNSCCFMRSSRMRATFSRTAERTTPRRRATSNSSWKNRVGPMRSWNASRVRSRGRSNIEWGIGLVARHSCSMAPRIVQYTAQFFAHTAYALVFCAFSLLAYVGRFDLSAGAFTYGFTVRRFFLLLLLYATSSAFFVLARVQLATLFRAEQDLIAKSEGKRLRRWPPLLRGQERSRRSRPVAQT
jgi:hypothetical protein